MLALIFSITSLYFSATSIAVTGKPLPKPLPRVITSGTVSQCSMANILPVRAMQVSTSSAISRMPYSSHSARIFWIQPSGGTTLPAQPWIGSSTMPATRPAVSSLMTVRM